MSNLNKVGYIKCLEYTHSDVIFKSGKVYPVWKDRYDNLYVQGGDGHDYDEPITSIIVPGHLDGRNWGPWQWVAEPGSKWLRISEHSRLTSRFKLGDVFTCIDLNSEESKDNELVSEVIVHLAACDFVPYKL